MTPTETDRRHYLLTLHIVAELVLHMLEQNTRCAAFLGSIYRDMKQERRPIGAMGIESFWVSLGYVPVAFKIR